MDGLDDHAPTLLLGAQGRGRGRLGLDSGGIRDGSFLRGLPRGAPALPLASQLVGPACLAAGALADEHALTLQVPQRLFHGLLRLSQEGGQDAGRAPLGGLLQGAEDAVSEGGTEGPPLCLVGRQARLLRGGSLRALALLRGIHRRSLRWGLLRWLGGLLRELRLPLGGRRLGRLGAAVEALAQLQGAALHHRVQERGQLARGWGPIVANQAQITHAARERPRLQVLLADRVQDGRAPGLPEVVLRNLVHHLALDRVGVTRARGQRRHRAGSLRSDGTALVGLGLAGGGARVLGQGQGALLGALPGGLRLLRRVDPREAVLGLVGLLREHLTREALHVAVEGIQDQLDVLRGGLQLLLLLAQVGGLDQLLDLRHAELGGAQLVAPLGDLVQLAAEHLATGAQLLRGEPPGLLGVGDHDQPSPFCWRSRRRRSASTS